MTKKLIIIIAAGVVVLIGIIVCGYFAWNKFQQDKKTLSIDQATNAAKMLSEMAGGGTLPSFSTNPMENKPNLNPVDKANPIKNIKTNPFE